MEKIRIIGCAILKKSPGNEFFSLDQIIEVTGLDRIGIRRVLEQLTREKLILKIDKRPGYMKVTNAHPYPESKGRPPLAITYHVKNKKKLTERVAPKLKEGTALDRMWSIIRARGRFTVRDLIVLAEVGLENARWFVKMLRRAGFVRPLRPGGPGVEWILIKDPGPKRPHVGKAKVKAKVKGKTDGR